MKCDQIMWVIDSSGKATQRRENTSRMMYPTTLPFCREFFDEDTYKKILLRSEMLKEKRARRERFNAEDISINEGTIREVPFYDRFEEKFVATSARWGITFEGNIQLFFDGHKPPLCEGEILHTEIINKGGFEWECVRCGSLYFKDGRLKKLNVFGVIIDK